LINAYTTNASHEAARTALARIAKSVVAGFTANGVTKARIARPREIANSFLIAFGAMLVMLVRVPGRDQVTFGRFLNWRKISISLIMGQNV
jgi:hypothetical protein